ncbi:MAG: hypothetical protein ACIALR_11210, partial [Blastopirellula sp. JB062]
MKLTHLTAAALLLFAVPCCALLHAAEDPAAEETKKEASDPLQKLKDDPNNIDALNAYLQANIGYVMAQANQDAEAALKKLKEIRASLSDIKPTEERAKRYFEQTNSILDNFADRIELQKMSLKELREKIAAAPEDATLIGKYGMKVMMELAGSVNTDWKKAEQGLKEETAYLESLAADSDVD